MRNDETKHEQWKSKKKYLWLIIGIIIYLLGAYQNIQYEDHSLTVRATITDIKTVDDTDDGPTSYKHTYYGEYTVDGKKYTNMKLATKYTSSLTPPSLGKTIDVKVYPNNPARKVPEGGLFITAGTLMIIYNVVILWRNRKSRKENQYEADN